MSQTTSTLADYWIALYSRKWIILAVAASCTIATIVISMYLPPIYEAKSSFYVPINLVTTPYTGLPSQSTVTQSTLKPLPDEKEAGIHIGILKSADIAVKAQERFPEKDLEFFKKNVDFVASPQFFIDIYVRDTDPNMAASVANAYVTLYREFHKDALIRNAAENQIVQERQVESLRKKLADKITEIRNRQGRTDNKLHAENRTTITILEAERRTLQTMLTNAEMSLAEATLQGVDPRMEVIQVQTAKPPKNPSFPIVTLNAIVAFVLGFAVACYNALLLEYLRRLKIEKMRRNLDVSLLDEVVR